jgi:hypothetical protein
MDDLKARGWLHVCTLACLLDFAIADEHHARATLWACIHCVEVLGDHGDILRSQRKWNRYSYQKRALQEAQAHCAPPIGCG